MSPEDYKQSGATVMISRKLRLVITFSSTTDALLLEQSCKENQISGGLIPGAQDDFCQLRTGLEYKC